MKLTLFKLIKIILKKLNLKRKLFKINILYQEFHKKFTFFSFNFEQKTIPHKHYY
jgi:hypothetical protein